jgi:hypothetical protein
MQRLGFYDVEHLESMLWASSLGLIYAQLLREAFTGLKETGALTGGRSP